jgi:formyltetrahydrofolate hydrolase
MAGTSIVQNNAVESPKDLISRALHSNSPLQEQRSQGNDYENNVFVSYAWGGESERTVDELERAFATRGIRIVRDKKDLSYKGSIETFEKRIGRGKCIVLVISDKYLRSEHCMYELLQVYENRELRKRIFPIVLADARIYKALDRVAYIKYWEEQIEQLNQSIKEMKVMTHLDGITADLEKYTQIRNSFDHLTDLLSDMNALSPELHAVHGFSALIRAVEFSLKED